VTVYAYADIVLAEDKDILLKLGSDDGFKCWFNGKQVGASYANRGCRPDDDVLPVKGVKGRNTVLIKVAQGGWQWGVALRVVDTDNKPIPGLQE